MEQNTDAWFQDYVYYSRLACLCTTGYMTISHGMLMTFIDRLPKKRHLSTSLMARYSLPLMMSHAFYIFQL